MTPARPSTNSRHRAPLGRSRSPGGPGARNSSPAPTWTPSSAPTHRALQLRPHRGCRWRPGPGGPAPTAVNRTAPVEHPDNAYCVGAGSPGIRRSCWGRRTQPGQVRLPVTVVPPTGGSWARWPRRHHYASSGPVPTARRHWGTITTPTGGSFPLVLSNTGDGDDGVLRPVRRGRRHRGDALRRAGDAGVLVDTVDGSIWRCSGPASTPCGHLRRPGRRRLTELTPGVRSLQVQFDPAVISMRGSPRLIRTHRRPSLPGTGDLVVPAARSGCRCRGTTRPPWEYIQRYMHGVPGDAPWCQTISRFIRRINGLGDVSDVYDTVFVRSTWCWVWATCTWAPRYHSLDPRHRLVTHGTTRGPGHRKRHRHQQNTTCASMGWAPAAADSSAAPQVWNLPSRRAKLLQPGTLGSGISTGSGFPTGQHRRVGGPACRYGRRPWARRHHGRPVLDAGLHGLPGRECHAVAEFPCQQGVAFAADGTAWGPGRPSPTSRPVKSRPGQVLPRGTPRRANLPLVVRGWCRRPPVTRRRRQRVGARHAARMSAIPGRGRPAHPAARSATTTVARRYRRAPADAAT